MANCKTYQGIYSKSYGPLALKLVYKMHQPTVHVCNKFNFITLTVSWEKCDEKFSLMALILVYTINQPIVHVFTKFQLCSFHSSSEIYNNNHMY